MAFDDDDDFSVSGRDDCGGGAVGDPTKPSVEGVLDGVEFDDSGVAAGVVAFFAAVAVAVVVVAVDVVVVPKRDGLGAGACEVEAPANRDGLGAGDCDDVVPVPKRDGLGAVDCEDVVAAPAPKIDDVGAGA